MQKWSYTFLILMTVSLFSYGASDPSDDQSSQRRLKHNVSADYISDDDTASGGCSDDQSSQNCFFAESLKEYVGEMSTEEEWASLPKGPTYFYFHEIGFNGNQYFHERGCGASWEDVYPGTTFRTRMLVECLRKAEERTEVRMKDRLLVLNLVTRYPILSS